MKCQGRWFKVDQIQKDELAAVIDVITSGCYSGYLAGTLHGGPQVEALEEEWADMMGFGFGNF